MDRKITKGIVRGKVCWIVDIKYLNKRYRKFFKSRHDAQQFDTLAFLNGKKEEEPAGEETILSVAKDLYLKEYSENNHNPAKPKQKGLKTTTERVNRFLNWFGDSKRVSDVTVDDYKEYINAGKLSEKTRQEYGRAVRIFMAWCAKHGYGGNVHTWYMNTNPCLKNSKKKTYFKLPEILSVEQARALLDQLDKKYKPCMAIMLFTGIRPEVEMLSLDYSSIRWGKTIGLKAELTKTGRERWVKPPENLWGWVPKSKGAVMPSYYAITQARRKAARRAGFNYPANGARHSFASYGYWKDFAWALDTMGHMSSETFLKNYKNNRVDKKISTEYFSIV